jgi:O-antigen/teichoic acid export membrane protein
VSAVTLLRRRAATALGSYGATALGIVGTIVAANVLGVDDFGRLALVLATVALFQLFLDLTSEEALVKYGFRYAEREDWGRFRRLFELAFGLKSASAVLAGLLICALAPFSDAIFGVDLTVPLLVASPLPLLYSVEGTAAAALLLRGRYDVRAFFLFVSMTLRLVALVIGTQYGVTETVVALVLAQVVATGAIGVMGLEALRRFPRAERVALADDRREIVGFVVQSSVGTGIVSVRGWISQVLLGVVSTVAQVGLFRAAQAPQQGLAALSSPVRLILLTEQTRHWERGRPEAVLAGLRRYTVGAALLMVVAVPVFWWLMPWLFDLVLPDYSDAVDAARIVLIAGAIQLVYGWSKSLPVSIGRPNLRVLAHGIETVVLVPLLVVLGAQWGATGAATAVLVSTIVFAAVWTFLLTRIRAHPPVQVSTV